MVGVTSGIGDEHALVDVAVRLGARSVPGWSGPEERLAAAARRHRDRGPGRAADLAAVRDQIQAGEDPLGDAFCRLRGRAERRALGQTFTPPQVIASMISWAASAVEAGGAAGTGGVIGTVGVIGADGVAGPGGGALSGRRAGSGGATRDGDGGPARVVDPGAGSARFLIAAGRRWHRASLLGAEIDPVAAIIGRANLAAAGLAGRSRVLLEDYRTLRLPSAAGPTLFIGNPPYLRHHQIPPDWKRWLRSTARALDLPSSGLAGLHVHFFLATAVHAEPGDLGVFITAAEWLDVNYGSLVRALMLGPLGGESVHLIEPAVPVFSDAQATSAISCFTPGSDPRPLRLRRVASVAELGALAGGAVVPARSLAAAERWGPMLRAADPGPAGPSEMAVPSEAAVPAGAAAGMSRPAPRLPADRVELGELCRVHRGQVTGANAVWVAAAGAAGADRVPERFRFPAVTRARELFQAWDVLPVGTPLRVVIDLPADLGQLSAQELHAVELFLGRARAAGAADSYIARHRRPWWRVRLREPPPILATYMARRPPAFVRNLAGARYLNIAHGIYPREQLPAGALDGLAAFLRGSVVDGVGRVYAGGLLKFEPGEMQRLPVPGPQLLAACADPVRSSRGTTCGGTRTCRE
jgi:adenine-specific DNA-methyltransferase